MWVESEGPATPCPFLANRAFPMISLVGRCHGNWVGRGWSGRASTTCQERVLASLDGLWLWLRASDMWILSAANKSVLWGPCSACGVWPTASSLPAGKRRDNGVPQGLACMGLLPSHCSLLVCLSLPVCLCVCPILFPSSCPLMEASWKLTVWDRTSLYILWPQWPPALLLRFRE